MKKTLLVFLACVFFSLASCSGNTYSYTNKELSVPIAESNAVFPYPYFASYSDAVNAEIESAVKNIISSLDTSAYDTFDSEYEVKTAAKSEVSIVFTSFTSAKSAAHPTTYTFTVNIDPSTGTRLRLKDIVTVNTDFVKQFKALWDEQAPKGYTIAYSDEMLEEMLRSADTENSTVYSFLTTDSVGIIMEAPHAVGDFVVVNMPRSK